MRKKGNSMKQMPCALFLGLCMAAPLHAAETISPDDDGAIPRSVNMEDFDALVTNSPFTRSLGVSDSLILTGVAHFEKDTFATLLDTKTFESHVVSKTPNFQGWQLVGVGGNSAEIQTWSAKIQIPGGEVISVRYQKPPPRPPRSKSGGSSSGTSGGNAPPLTSSQLNEAKAAAVNYKEGFSSDGYPKAPPPEMVAKLSRLSTSQRETINQQMLGLRNQGLGLDERRKIYEGLVERSLQGR
ncbi:MAG: hypothetical protein WAW39_22785 [Prosthecobacter sp.]|uniref:hypothetical protein n=1 Tax=Prosthecobacter sp. TaxID=1965333 RepID=UPI003BB0AA3C